MYSDMSMRTIACSSSNRNSASARAVSVLPTPVGPRKMNEPIGRLGSCRPGAAAAHGVRHGDYRVALADDALGQLVVELGEARALALHHPRDRDAGPPRHHVGDVVSVTSSLRNCGRPSCEASFCSASRIRRSSSGMRP
jgi:hypothetical protein